LACALYFCGDAEASGSRLRPAFFWQSHGLVFDLAFLRDRRSHLRMAYGRYLDVLTGPWIANETSRHDD
jgi:hypothetical protein